MRARPARCAGSMPPRRPTCYRFVLEHFAAVTAPSVDAPDRHRQHDGGRRAGRRRLATTPIRASRCATSATARSPRSTIDRVTFTAAMDAARQEGEDDRRSRRSSRRYDFDAAATLAMLDPARAKDDKVYRAYRQMTAGAYTATFENGHADAHRRA